MPAVFPISFLSLPFAHNLRINSIIHDFGDGFEQRINLGLPRGPRSDGEGNQSTYIGVNEFRISFTNLTFQLSPVSGNTNLDNSIRKLWAFYKSLFYDPATGQVKYDAFYIYNINENDNALTWTGDTTSNGNNSRGEAVTNLTGRYLVRFKEANLTYNRFKACLFNGQLDVVEVVA